ncbi:TPA: hypothetical protein ACPUF5_004990, partial [Klebsiella pneumoniae]
MASLDDKSLFEDIFRLENDTPAEAIGPEGDISYANIQAQQLANRTRWLRTQLVSISDFREYTFFKTAEDPDGTIAGRANTPNGKLFRVSQGEGDELAFKYYLHKDGVAIPDTTLIGIGSIKNTIRAFPTLAAAQADADAGNINLGATSYYRSPDDIALAVELINIDGNLQPTGRKMPSRSSMVIGIVDSWVNNTLYPFDSLSSPNENAVSMNVAAVSTIAYREAYSALLSPVAVGDIITVRYKYSGTGGAPTIGLKTSLNGTFVSNQPTLTSSNDWQEVQLTATAATATLLAIGVNTRLATTVQLSIIAYASKKNAITTAILNSLDSISSLNGKARIGSVDSWVNNNGYPFSVFSQVNNNRVNYVNSTGVYSEMYANINVPSGRSLTFSYSLDATAGRLFARLANGSAWTGDEVQLAGGGARQTITLVAAADTKQLKLYTRAEISAGSFFAEVNYGQKNALTEQIDSLYSAVASANAVLAILSQSSTFDSFVKSSPYTYTLSDAGVAYKQAISTVDNISGLNTVKMMYKISSSNAALKIQSRNGSNWGANERTLVADGDYHEIDLPIASGQVFSGWGVYSSAKAGGYSADVTMIPISANGVFFTPA